MAILRRTAAGALEAKPPLPPGWGHRALPVGCGIVHDRERDDSAHHERDLLEGGKSITDEIDFVDHRGLIECAEGSLSLGKNGDKSLAHLASRMRAMRSPVIDASISRQQISTSSSLRSSSAERCSAPVGDWSAARRGTTDVRASALTPRLRRLSNDQRSARPSSSADVSFPLMAGEIDDIALADNFFRPC